MKCRVNAREWIGMMFINTLKRSLWGGVFMKKKVLAIMLSLVMVFTLAACGNGGNGGDTGERLCAGMEVL